MIGFEKYLFFLSAVHLYCKSQSVKTKVRESASLTLVFEHRATDLFHSFHYFTFSTLGSNNTAFTIILSQSPSWMTILFRHILSTSLLHLLLLMNFWRSDSPANSISVCLPYWGSLVFTKAPAVFLSTVEQTFKISTASFSYSLIMIGFEK